MKSLSMHITNQKLRFDIFTVGNLLNNLMEHDLNDFWHKRKMDNFDPCNVLLAIATNIPVLLMTGFVLQGHTCAISEQTTLFGSRATANKPRAPI